MVVRAFRCQTIFATWGFARRNLLGQLRTTLFMLSTYPVPSYFAHLPRFFDKMTFAGGLMILSRRALRRLRGSMRHLWAFLCAEQGYAARVRGYRVYYEGI